MARTVLALSSVGSGVKGGSLQPHQFHMVGLSNPSTWPVAASRQLMTSGPPALVTQPLRPTPDTRPLTPTALPLSLPIGPPLTGTNVEAPSTETRLADATLYGCPCGCPACPCVQRSIHFDTPISKQCEMTSRHLVAESSPDFRNFTHLRYDSARANSHPMPKMRNASRQSPYNKRPPW